MHSRARPRKKIKYNYPLTGFITCGTCGCAITAEKQKGHVYYRCTKKKGQCEEKYIREEALSEKLKTEIQKVSLSSADTDQMLKWLDKEKMDKESQVKARIDDLEMVKVKLEAKLDTLLDAHLDCTIEKDIYIKKKGQIMDQVQNIQEEIKQIQAQGGNWLEPLRDFIFLVRKAKKTAENRDLREFKSFLKNIGSNFILKGKKFEFLAKKEWATLARSAAYPSLWAG